VQVDDFAQVLRQNSPASVAILSPSFNGKPRPSAPPPGISELTVPVIGKDNRLPFVDALDFDFAARHEAYGAFNYRSTFGSGLASTVGPNAVDASPSPWPVR